MHNNQVSDDFATPVPCLADPNLIAYDTSISDVSGLQVPPLLACGRAACSSIQLNKGYSEQGCTPYSVL